MFQGQTVIYIARTIQDAHSLKNLLAGERIQAIVLTDPSQLGPSQPGLESETADWATAAGVAVSEQDASRAKQLAVRFDRKMASAAARRVAEQSGAEESPTVLDAWPKCPECDTRRSTRCTICHTAGTDFPQSDMGFLWIPGSDEAAEATPSCQCGSQGVACDATADADEPATASEECQESPVTLLVCPTCDEPFQPEYPRLCEWCGHEFEDGFDAELPTNDVGEVGSRVLAVFVGLLLLAGGVVAYFAFILSGPPASQ